MANRVSVIIDVATKSATSALQQLRTDVSNAEGSFGKLKAGGKSAFDSVKANAGAMALGVAAAAATIAAEFGVRAVGAFQDLALEAGKTSEATGIAVEDVSRLIEVAGDLGIEAGTVEGAIRKMNLSLADGKAPTKELSEEIVRAKDGTIDSYNSFINLATAIGQIRDPTLRAKAAQETFGRSYGEIAELMKMDADDLRAALGAVSDEKVIDEDEVRKAREFRETMDKLKDAAENVQLQLGEYLVPIIRDLGEVAAGANELVKTFGLDGLGGLIEKARELTPLAVVAGWIRDIRGDSEDAEPKVNELSGSFVRAAAEGEAAARKMAELEEETANLEEAAKEAEEAWRKLKGEFSIESEALDVAQSFDDIKAKAEESFIAVAEGHLTSEEAARGQRQAVLDLKGTVADYIQNTLGGMPDEKTTRILALIDQGKFTEAEEALNQLTRGRYANVVVTTSGDLRGVAPGGRRATGGLTDRRPYIAGEAGPELIVPGGSGDQVFSAGQTSRMLAGASGGGGAVVINATINGNRSGQDMYNELVAAIRRNGGTALAKALGV